MIDRRSDVVVAGGGAAEIAAAQCRRAISNTPGGTIPRRP